MVKEVNIIDIKDDNKDEPIIDKENKKEMLHRLLKEGKITIEEYDELIK